MDNKPNRFEGLRKYLRYWKYGLALVVLLFSIKPFLFTLTLIKAGNTFKTHQSARHLTAVILQRPSAYHALTKYDKAAADRLLLKTLIISGQYSRLKSAGPSVAEMARITETYKNNPYLHTLFPGRFPNLQESRNLDDLSLDMLADSELNDLNLQMLNIGSFNSSKEFLVNLREYCRWKKNEFMALKFNEKLSGGPLAPEFKPSGTMHPAENGNLLPNPGLESQNGIVPDWVFSDMSDTKPFGPGSFTMGGDRVQGNDCLRIMGFFVGAENHVSKRARAGVWCQKSVPIGKEVYRFSFYYATGYGKEKASFFLWQNIGEHLLTHTRGEWRQAEFILDNRQGRFTNLRPLIRMWGTGILWVDNISLTTVKSKVSQ